MVSGSGKRGGIDVAVVNGSRVSKWAVELDNEIILEILRHAAIILGGVSCDTAVCRIDSHARTIVESVNHNISVVGFGESETHDCSAVGRSDFGHYIEIGEICSIIIRSGDLSLVREPACAFILIEDGAPGNRHDSKLTIVVDPRRGLMSLLEAADFVGIIGVGPAIAHFAGLGSPEVHTPGHCHSGVGVTRREGMFRLRAYESANVVNRIFRHLCRCGESGSSHKSEYSCCVKMFMNRVSH